MKKSLFLGVLALAASSLGASAETFTPYQEGFEGNSYRPKGWLQVCGSSYAAGTYTLNTTGGHAGKCVAVNQYSNYYSSYYKNYSYNDYLITPAVSGEVSIWVKKNGTDPSLSLHKVADINASVPSSGYPFLDGTDMNLLADKNVDDWTQITISGVPAGTYLAVRGHNVLLDDFSSTSADVTYRPSVVVDAKNITEPNNTTTLEANADNKVAIKFSVTLNNNGDIDFPSSPTNFKVELKNVSLDKVVGTAYITDALPSGTIITKEFTMPFEAELAEGTKSNPFRAIISTTSFGSVEASLGYFTIIPYEPVATFMLGEDNDKNQNNFTDVNITESVNIGMGAAGTSRTLWMWNSGTAPMKVNNTTLTGDFAADVNAFTLARGEKKAVKVSLKGNPGIKEGTIVFNIDGLGDKTYSLRGLVSKAGDYTQDFEVEAMPAGFIAGKSWALENTPDALKTLGGDKLISCKSTYSTDRVILPKLTFAQGETLNFMASKTDNTSSRLVVYTSADRIEWTPVATIATRDVEDAFLFPSDKPTGTGYGTYEYKVFSVPMPQGDVYVALEAGGARVDNICGGVLTPVEHDIYVSKFGVPDKANVNTRFICSVTASNILAEPEKDYDVVLELAGEVMAHATETPEMTTNNPVDFDLRFTPHETGQFEAQLVFVSGDYRQVLHEFTVKVDPEMAEATYQVGDAKITTNDPFNTFYAGSQCQIIYRKADLDMAAGMKIIGTTFNGYATDDCKKHVKVWAQNTSDERYDFSNIVVEPTANMTLVYEGDYLFRAGGDNSSKTYVPMMEISFNAPFEYTGSNVRLMYELTDIDGETTDKHVFFTVDNSAYNFYNDLFDDRAITAKVEFKEDLEDNPTWTGYKAGFPVTYFKVAKDVVLVHGTLTDDFDKPVSGVEVKFESDGMLYHSVSDAQGAYYINVGNLDHVFTLSVDSELFSPVALPDVTLDPKKQSEFVHNFKLAYIDRTATLSGKIYNLNDDIEPLSEGKVILTKGDIHVEAVTADDGSYSVTVPSFTGEYTLEVYDGDLCAYSKPYTFKSKADTLDLDVEGLGVDAVKSSAADIRVAVSGNTVSVYAPAGTQVAVYSTLGVAFGSKLSDGSAVSFTLAPGIYIVAGRKIVVR